MINQVKKLLEKSGYNALKNEFENHFLSHPNYPSLLAISDGLSQSNIEHVAATIPFKYLAELPKNFIAELNMEGVKDFYLLTKKDEKHYYVVNEKENKQINNEDLEKQWTGVCLVIEENEKGNSTVAYNKVEYSIYAVLIVASLFFGIFNNLSIPAIVLSIVSIVGIIISVEIAKSYFHKDAATEESKFCSFSENFSCKSIINSNSKLFSTYIEFVDLPIVFFVFSYLLLLFVNSAESLIGVFSLLSLPVVLYSIYSQKFILKKWCFLCLLVSTLLLTNSVVFVLLIKKFDFSLIQVLTALILGLFVFGLWYALKKLIKSNTEYKSENSQLLRFKRNDEVFTAVSKNVEFLNEFNLLPKMVIGDRNSPNALTLFLSPSCPHCHVAYKEAKELYSKYPEQINIQIAYNLNINNAENPYLDIARTILQLASKSKNFIQALDDWHIDKMDLEIWKKKWKVDNDFINENEILEKQLQWCTKNEFNYAPVKIFNKTLMPQQYNINELFYFFKDEE